MINFYILWQVCLGANPVCDRFEYNNPAHFTKERCEQVAITKQPFPGTKWTCLLQGEDYPKNIIGANDGTDVK